LKGTIHTIISDNTKEFVYHHRDKSLMDLIQML